MKLLSPQSLSLLMVGNHADRPFISFDSMHNILERLAQTSGKLGTGQASVPSEESLEFLLELLPLEK